MIYIANPKTGRPILVNGPTYNSLQKDPKWRNLLKSATVVHNLSNSHGCSNKGKYPDVPAELFCGPSGGSCNGTYPVNTPSRARAALAYARFAPNPEGIRSCVNKIKKQKNW